MKWSLGFLGMLALAITVSLSSSAMAVLTPYSQDFEGLDQTSASALSDDGWNVGANVFDTDGTTFLYNYFTFPAPNGGPAFSGITRTDTVPPGVVLDGDQSLVVYSDYNNADHGLGRFINGLVFQERAGLDASDVGKTATFNFEATPGDLVAPTTAQAFIKIIDPNNGFATTALDTFDTTSLPSGNTSVSLSVFIDPSKVGQILQFGYESTATNFNASGVVYDNINFTVIPEPASLCLAGMGLIAVVGLRRNRNRS